MSNSIAFFKMPAIAAYQIAVKEGDKALEKMAARKDVKAEVDYFKNNIQSVKSVEDLFKDRRPLSCGSGMPQSIRIRHRRCALSHREERRRIMEEGEFLINHNPRVYEAAATLVLDPLDPKLICVHTISTRNR